MYSGNCWFQFLVVIAVLGILASWELQSASFSLTKPSDEITNCGRLFPLKLAFSLFIRIEVGDRG
jgi:hypothetical protein